MYKSYGETIDCIKADDITVSVLREAKPEKLFRYFEEHGYTITKSAEGIYHIKDKVLFPTQVVVTKELEGNSHKWLKALSGNLRKEDIRELLDDRVRMSEKADKEFADSVLEVSIGANLDIIEELRKGDDSMNAVLMEMMRPELQESKKVGRIIGAVETLKELGFGNKEIETKIIKAYNISEEEAEKYLQE